MTDAKHRKDGPDWWRGAVIYQIYPRSYQALPGAASGSLAAITRRLPHIAALGVDAVWLSPFFKSPMADMGYDVSDYCDVDPIFGTLADFDALVEEAHRLGLKVMIDQVISHSSDRHAWFRESRSSRDNPRADWYVWADPRPDGTAPNNWLSIFGGPAWEWDGVRRQYYMHNFLASQPDLNFHNPEVQDALLAAMAFWLERGVDGFRLDTVNYFFHDALLRDNPPAVLTGEGTQDAPASNPYIFQNHIHDKTQPENLGFLERIRALLDRYENRATVGEVGDGGRSLETVAAYTAGNGRLNMCYTFDLLSPDFSAAHVRACVQEVEARAPDGWICWALSNHDVPRHVSRFMQAGDDQDRVAKIAISMLACLRGSLCLYQGEELGLTEADIAFEDLQDNYGIRFWPAFKGRDGARTPMVWEADKPYGGFSTVKPWLPVPDEHRVRAVDVQEGHEGSVLEHYRATLAFRAARPAIVEGEIAFISTNDDLLAFTRSAGGETLLFVFNLTRMPREFVLPDVFAGAGQIAMPGFLPRVEQGVVKLEGLDAFCCVLKR